jgi:hypothetical protein
MLEFDERFSVAGPADIILISSQGERLEAHKRYLDAASVPFSYVFATFD